MKESFIASRLWPVLFCFQMREDVEMTELALAFPLFDEQDLSLGRRHQVYLISFLILIILDRTVGDSDFLTFLQAMQKS